MNSQEFRALQEAYNQVYDESYKDLGDKARNRGQRLLNKSKTTATRGNMYTGVLPSNTPEGEKLQNRASQQFAASAFHNPEKAQAKAAANKAKGENKKKAFGNRLMRSDGQGIRDSYEYDLYDIILSHLLDEGYADTQQAAEAIMVNMSEEWRGSIVEEVLDEAEGSYGQTPKADAAYTALATGKGKSKTKSLALKHAIRSAADRYNSDKPYSHRSKMTQSDRDYHRGQSENSGKDREGIDFDEFDTGASGPGGKPKGKKLERQRKTGVSD